MSCCTNFFVYKILLHAYYLPKNPSYFPDTPKFQIGLEIYRVIKCNSTIPICFLLRKYLLKKFLAAVWEEKSAQNPFYLNEFLPPVNISVAESIHNATTQPKNYDVYRFILHAPRLIPLGQNSALKCVKKVQFEQVK